jgi:cell division protein FtsB
VRDLVQEGLALLALLLVLGWYLSYSAARLDRLHHRVETTRAALDAQLARRAAAAVEAAPLLDPATGLLVADAAARALGAAEARTEWLEGGEPAEEVENDLTRALHAAFGDPGQVAELREGPLAAQSLDLLAQACVRVQLARRFHNDAVAQAVRVRRKPVVRWARLAGHASLPVMVEIDDSVPAGLGM